MSLLSNTNIVDTKGRRLSQTGKALLRPLNRNKPNQTKPYRRGATVKHDRNCNCNYTEKCNYCNLQLQLQLLTSLQLQIQLPPQLQSETQIDATVTATARIGGTFSTQSKTNEKTYTPPPYPTAVQRVLTSSSPFSRVRGARRKGGSAHRNASRRKHNLSAE